MTRAKKTKLVERTRGHYARSRGDSTLVRVEDPLAIDLDLPASYAADLLVELRRSFEELA